MRYAEHFIVDTRGYARSMSAEACLLRLAGIGFRSFEIALAPGHMWPGDMDAAGCLHFRRFVAGQRLRVKSLGLELGNVETFSSDAAMRSRAADLAGRAFELAVAISVEGVVVRLGGKRLRNGGSAGCQHFVDVLGQLADAAAKAGTALWVANSPASPVTSGVDLAELVDAFGDARAGAVLDVREADGNEIATVVHRLGPRLKGVRVQLPSSWTDDEAARVADLLDAAGHADVLAIDVAEGTSDPALQDGARRLVAAGLGRPMSTSDVDDA